MTEKIRKRYIMKRIILTTESGADLPKNLAEKHNVYVVPMHIIMDGRDHLDGVLPIQDIFDYHERTKSIPSTTATNPHEYHDLFTKIRTHYPDSTIVHVGYTSKASSSFQNAVLAAEKFDDLFLIDALNVTGGLAAIVLQAVDILEKQPDIEPDVFVEHIKAIIPKSRLAFVPGRLDFLKAGGRVSNAAYFGGILLKVKPRIELVDGKLVSTKKYRGKMYDVAIKLMQDYLKKYDIDRNQLYLMYSVGLEENIKRQIGEIAKSKGFKNVMWIQAGAMITTHAGPGGFGIAGLEV